jgi:hypothetical protein
MQQNVGSTERYARVAAGLVAGTAATQTTGWTRTALGAISATGLATGLSGYCPLNQITGRDSIHDVSPLDQGLRDTELRRHAAMHSALGSTPTRDTDQPPVTPAFDVFGTA